MKKLLLVLAAVLLLGLATSVSPASAGSVPDAEPYPGNPHWARQAGSEALIQIQIDASAKAMIPLVDDSVAMWNLNSPYMNIYRLPGGVECYFGVHCVIVAEANNYPCGGAQTFMNWNTSMHFQPALIAINFADCSGPTLLELKYWMCHEFGHGPGGMQHAGGGLTGARPCSPGDGRPTSNDYNTRNFLGVHAH